MTCNGNIVLEEWIVEIVVLGMGDGLMRTWSPVVKLEYPIRRCANIIQSCLEPLLSKITVICRALFEKTSKHFSNYNFFHGRRLVTLSLFHLTITVFFLTFYTQLSFWLFFFQKFPRTDFFRSQSNREIRGSSCNLFPFLFTNLFWKVLNLSNLPP